MPTRLTKPVSRVTNRKVGKHEIIVTIAPCGSENEARVGFRLLRKRTQYVCAVSDLYRVAALWHGQKEARARTAARRAGIPWKTAKRQFIADNSI